MLHLIQKYINIQQLCIGGVWGGGKREVQAGAGWRNMMDISHIYGGHHLWSLLLTTWGIEYLNALLSLALASIHLPTTTNVGQKDQTLAWHASFNRTQVVVHVNCASCPIIGTKNNWLIWSIRYFTGNVIEGSNIITTADIHLDITNKMW